MVEDQEDVRRMLVMVLEIEGHEVDQASTAQDGLTHLQRSHYDLVLSDYAMPGQTGVWMLNEAGRQGLLERTATLIMTAHPDIHDLSDIEVISKPLDLDLFVDQIRRILQPETVETQPEARVRPLPIHRVELVRSGITTIKAAVEESPDDLCDSVDSPAVRPQHAHHADRRDRAGDRR